MSRYRQIMQ